MTGTNHSAGPPNFGQTPATLVFLFIFYYVVSSLRRTPVQPATCGLWLSPKSKQKNTIISILALATSFDICADFSAVPLSVTNGIQNTSNVFSLTCFLEKINNFSAQKVRLVSHEIPCPLDSWQIYPIKTDRHPDGSHNESQLL